VTCARGIGKCTTVTQEERRHGPARSRKPRSPRARSCGSRALYNERNTLVEVLRRMRGRVPDGIESEIIVVEDGSNEREPVM